MSSKLRFFGLFSAFLLVLFVSCSSSKSNKCSEDKECQYGSYCSTDEGKCTAFEESDYKIAITTPEDGAHLCGEVTVEVALSEVSEKISDGKGVALAVEKDKDMQVMKETLSNQSASFKLDLSESGEYKLSAFLMQNPYVKAKITLYCDSDPEPVDDDSDTDTPDEDETEPVVDDDAEGDPIDEDEDTLDEDDDTPDEEADEVEPEAKPVAEITSHPQAVSSLATAEFTFESDIEEATFRCKIDANEWESCASPKVYENLVEGDHQFSLKAVNVGGTESDVVSFSWKIDFTIAVIQILAPWNSDKTGNGEACSTAKTSRVGWAASAAMASKKAASCSATRRKVARFSRSGSSPISSSISTSCSALAPTTVSPSAPLKKAIPPTSAWNCRSSITKATRSTKAVSPHGSTTAPSTASFPPSKVL